MSPARPQNLAARAGRWSAKHRKKAIFGWLAFVLVAVVAGTAAGTIQIADNADGNGESGRADRTLSQAFPSGASEKVLIQDEHLTARDPRFRAAVDDVTRRLHRTPYVRDVSSPLDRGNAGRLAPDGHSALVEFEIAGSDDQTSSRVDATLAATSAAQRAHPALRIEQFGDASAHKQLAGSLDKDFA
ncbi:MAG: heme transporter, partial [Thermoleophilaceae bacterium]|nr:heme transporter [Thermoleophilaceae bacterium]